jgi:hypothetical protein
MISMAALPVSFQGPVTGRTTKVGRLTAMSRQLRRSFGFSLRFEAPGYMFVPLVAARLDG